MDSTLSLILSSSLAVALVTAVKELILWRLNRKAKLKDEAVAIEREENTTEKQILEHIAQQNTSIKLLSESQDKFQSTLESFLKSEKTLLRDKIRYLVFKYIEYGEITLDEKNAIKHMWHIYHFEWGGNGDLDDVMQMLEDVPVKIPAVHVDGKDD